MSIESIADIDLADKRVLIRSDLNVPIVDGEIRSLVRIEAALPTIRHCVQQAASVVVCSHLGRPRPGEYDPRFSLSPVALKLAELLRIDVKLHRRLNTIKNLREGECALLDNVRFLEGETTNSETLAQKLANLCDVFCLDAFGTAHRAHASTAGIARFVETACAGFLLEKEIDALRRALDTPRRPLIVVIGGAKVSTKLDALKYLIPLADDIIVGGGMANTFMWAQGVDVGDSLIEPDMKIAAIDLLTSNKLRLPVDLMVANEITDEEHARVRLANHIHPNEKIVDIGPITGRQWSTLLNQAGTVLWNGPMGIFEVERFGYGTQTIAAAIASSPAYSVAGGGETIAAIEQYLDPNDLDYISTGGGAFLDFIAGKELPALNAVGYSSPT